MKNSLWSKEKNQTCQLWQQTYGQEVRLLNGKTKFISNVVIIITLDVNSQIKKLIIIC